MTDKQNPALAATSKPGQALTSNVTKDNQSTQHCKCPTCGQSLPFDSLDWLEHLEVLLARYDSLCINPDLAALTLIEVWGVYLWLKGKEAAGHG